MDRDEAYHILGVKSGASPEDLRQAYRDLVKVWHPDRFAHDPKLQQKAQERLKEINTAFALVESLPPEAGAGAASGPIPSPPRPPSRGRSRSRQAPPTPPPEGREAGGRPEGRRPAPPEAAKPPRRGPTAGLLWGVIVGGLVLLLLAGVVPRKQWERLWRESRIVQLVERALWGGERR